MIELTSITKTFARVPVLRGISFKVPEGEFTALVGPNGAGKTTLLRIVASLAQPTFGRVVVGGYELPSQADEVRRMLGVVSHHPLLYTDLTAEENLRFYAEMYGVQKQSKRISEVLEQVGLIKRRKDLVRTFSRGMAQRLAIGRAILHSPQIMLLDEPHTGLDQDASAMLDRVLQTVATQGRTVLMISHDLPHALALANRVAILSRGKIVHEAATAGLDPIEFSKTYGELTNG